jgi:hypothetical protein
MLEYVSRNTRRKDYDDNMKKYERQLKVPYYMLFQPDVIELTLYRHTGKKYVSVKPNEHERYAIGELELEVALLDDWVRYWFRGELLPLPAELLGQLQAANRRAEQAEQQREHAERQREHAEQQREQAERLLEQERADRAALEAELARLRQELQGPKPRRNNHK